MISGGAIGIGTATGAVGSLGLAGLSTKEPTGGLAAMGPLLAGGMAAGMASPIITGVALLVASALNLGKEKLT